MQGQVTGVALEHSDSEMGGRCAEAPPCALRHAQREIDADKETGRADLALEGGEGVTGAESDLEDVFALSGIEQPQAGRAGPAFKRSFDQVVPTGEAVVGDTCLVCGARDVCHSRRPARARWSGHAAPAFLRNSLCSSVSVLTDALGRGRVRRCGMCDDNHDSVRLVVGFASDHDDRAMGVVDALLADRPEQ